MKTLTNSIQKHHQRKRCEMYQEACGDLPLTVDIIEKVVKNRYGLNYADIFTKTRRKAIVDPRQKAQFIIYATLKHKGMILQKIADRYRQQHDNVIHSCDSVVAYYTHEESYRDELDTIGKILGLNMHDLVFEYIKYKRRNKA